MKRTVTMAFMCVGLFSVCSTSDAQPLDTQLAARENSFELEFESYDDCLTGCPAYVIHLDEDGTVTFRGSEGNGRRIVRKYRVSRLAVHDIRRAIKDYRFFSLNERHAPEGAAPHGSIRLHVREESAEKTVYWARNARLALEIQNLSNLIHMRTKALPFIDSRACFSDGNLKYYCDRR